MTEESIKAHIVKIGNFQGIRIPKALLAMSGIQDNVEMSVANGVITIRPAREAREGWAASFQAMASVGDDAVFDPEIHTEWDTKDWEWK
jgi:antitoxin MazE